MAHMEIIHSVSEQKVGLFGGGETERIRPVDITFKDVTFTTWQLSLMDCTRGNYFVTLFAFRSLSYRK